MAGLFGTVVTIAATAVALTATLPNLVGAAAEAERRPASSSKGDRLAAPRPSPATPVFSAERAGQGSRVVLRDRDGSVVFLNDQALATTRISKGTDPASGVMASSSDVEAARKPVSAHARIPVGCERLLGALVRSARANPLGRCLT